MSPDSTDRSGSGSPDHVCAEPETRRGVRLGVDVGQARVGLAASDPQGSLAFPVRTLQRDLQGLSDLDAVVAECVARDVMEIVVGLPRSLSGEEGVAAQRAREYAQQLDERCADRTVRMWDERLTTVDAHRSLHASGVKSRDHRAQIDQAAAVLILQGALDAERAHGQPLGQVLGQRKPRKPRGTRRRGGPAA